MTNQMRMRFIQGLRFGAGLVLLLLLDGVPLHAQASSPAEAIRVLERAEARYAALDALCADFVQEMHVVLLNQVTRSEGKLCQKDPDLFIMRFTNPAGDLVVADGSHLWMYFPSMDRNQVVRSRLEASQGRFDFHREFLANPGQKYTPTHEGRETLQGRDTHVLHLVPRTQSAYRSARVWIDSESWLIRRVRIEEENGSIRQVDLANMEMNPAISRDLFHFAPPAGAQVIDR